MCLKIKRVLLVFLAVFTLLSGFDIVRADNSLNKEFIEISRILSSESIDDIIISASACSVYIDRSFSDNFEVVFRYPEMMKSQMKGVNLQTSQNDSVLTIATEFNDDLEIDEGVASFRLTIKIPDKTYKDISIQLGACDKSVLNLTADASKVMVTTKAGDISMTSYRAYESLVISNNAGDFKLKLKSMSSSIDISNNIGQFTLFTNQKPLNVMLTINNFLRYNEYGKYKLPADWSISKKYGTNEDGSKYESISALIGKGTNTIDVNNTVGGFIFQTETEKYQGNIE